MQNFTKAWILWGLILPGYLAGATGMALPDTTKPAPTVLIGTFADTLRLDLLPADSIITVRSIRLKGNFRTRDRIILREMGVHAGDTLRRRELTDKLVWDQRKINNTNLFVTVDVVARNVLPPGEASLKLYQLSQIDIEVTLKERWYIFPTPIFELADRNLNEWWYDRGHDLHRVNYGARLDYKNLTGRNDKLSAVAQFGFTRRLSLSYNRPYIDQAQRTGLTIDFSNSTNQEVAYRSYHDKWLYVKSTGELRERLGAGVTLTRRQGFYQFHALELRYTRNVIADTVAQLNPDYFGDKQLRQRYLALSYTYSYNRLDNVVYPLQGVLFRASVAKLGLLPTDALNQVELSGSLSRFWSLGAHFYANSSLRGRMGVPVRTPYSNLRGLGNGADFVRGYELYIIDGNRYGLWRSNIRYQLLNTRKELKWLHVRQFSTVPVAAYITAFADMGYVSSSVAEQYQSLLANRMLYGGGVSLDLVTFYNLVMRFSGTINAQGQRGFFFNLARDF